MISREQVEKYKVTGMWDQPINFPELLDTLAAANKEIEELKQKYLRILDYVLTYSNDPAIVRVAKAALHEKGGKGD